MTRDRLVPLVLLAVVVAGSLALSFHLWSATLVAGWSLPEDHHIHRALGADGKVGWRELGDQLLGSEAGRPGQSPRYRPLYFGLRLLETKLWGGNVRAWYLARILLFALMLAATWLALTRFTGFALAAAGAVLLAQPPYWVDIFGRLGAAAAYAAPALALAALGGAWLWRPTEGLTERGQLLARRFAWLLAGSGTFVAVGAKENLAFLPALLLLVAWRERQQGRLGALGVAATLVPTALAALVVGALATYFVRRPVDLYGDPIVGEAAWRAVWTGLASLGWRGLGPVAVAALAGSVALVVARLPGRRPLARRLGALAGLELVLLALVVSQIYVFRGRWSTANRYAFPSESLLLLAWLLPVALAVRSTGEWERLPTLVRRLLPAVTAAALLAVALDGGFRASRERTARDVARTRHYTEVFHELARAARDDPGAVIAVRSGSLVHVEGTIAAEALLRYLGATNPIVAVREPGDLDRHSAHAALIDQLLPLWAQIWEGRYGTFSPQTVLRSASSCLEVVPVVRPTGGIGCRSFGLAWRGPPQARSHGAGRAPLPSNAPPQARPRRRRRPPPRAAPSPAPGSRIAARDTIRLHVRAAETPWTALP
jgi:hypothetical protein